MELKCFYLRNNLCLEHLTRKDVDYVLRLTDQELLHPNRETMILIERTYPEVIDFPFGKDLSGMSCCGLDYDEYWRNSKGHPLGYYKVERQRMDSSR